MRLIPRLLFATALLSQSIAMAAPDKKAPLPSEVRLSDEEKEKVLEAAAASRREPKSIHGEQRATEEEEDSPPQIHGEVGFAIGTGGYRSAYGTAVVPLDSDAVAIISLGSADFGSRGRYLDPWWR